MHQNEERRLLPKNTAPINLGREDKYITQNLTNARVKKLKDVRKSLSYKIEQQTRQEVEKAERKRVAFGRYKTNYEERLKGY